jgi:hypothetical protein
MAKIRGGSGAECRLFHILGELLQRASSGASASPLLLQMTRKAIFDLQEPSCTIGCDSLQTACNSMKTDPIASGFSTSTNRPSRKNARPTLMKLQHFDLDESRMVTVSVGSEQASEKSSDKVATIVDR